MPFFILRGLQMDRMTKVALHLLLGLSFIPGTPDRRKESKEAVAQGTDHLNRIMLNFQNH